MRSFHVFVIHFHAPLSPTFKKKEQIPNFQWPFSAYRLTTDPWPPFRLEGANPSAAHFRVPELYWQTTWHCSRESVRGIWEWFLLPDMTWPSLMPFVCVFLILSLQRAESSLLLKAAAVINKSLARVVILDNFAAMDGLKFITDRVFIWSRDTEFRLCWLKHLNSKSNLCDAWYTAITMSDMIWLTHTTCCYTATLIHILKLTSYLFFWLNAIIGSYILILDTVSSFKK